MRSQGQASEPTSQVPLLEEKYQECTKTKGHIRTQPEGGHLEAKERGLTLTLPAPWPWTFSLQNCEKIHVCCLSHPVCDISLRQLKLPKTPSHLSLIKPCQGCLLIKVMKTTPFTEGLPCVRQVRGTCQSFLLPCHIPQKRTWRRREATTLPHAAVWQSASDRAQA